MDYLTTHTSLSPIRRGFAPGKRCTRLAAGSHKAYQLLVRGQWFCPGTLASSTTKTGLHDIAEILLKVALNSKNQNQSYLHYLCLLGNSVVQHILCCVFALFIFVYVDSFFGFSIVSLISRCNYLTDDTDVALTKLRETYSY